MVWRVISSDGERTLVKVEGKLYAGYYIKILKENLIEFEGIEEMMIFQQDLASCHRANKKLQYFADREIGVLN
jgi:hypothetical protein